MSAAVKAGLLLGAVLLIGGGVAARFVAPRLMADRPTFRKRVRAGTLAGLGLLAALSALDLVVTLQSAVGRVEPELFWSYLRNTGHGRATLLRYVLLPIVAALALFACAGVAGPRRHLMDALFVGFSIFVLGTVSVTSHAAAMGGNPAMLVDLAHFAAACAWAGPLFYLAIYPGWRTLARGDLTGALRALSRVGLASVGVLVASGLYSSLLHLQDPPAFVASPYGRVLGLKLSLVLLTVGLAGPKLHGAWRGRLEGGPADRTDHTRGHFRGDRYIEHESAASPRRPIWRAQQSADVLGIPVRALKQPVVRRGLPRPLVTLWSTLLVYSCTSSLCERVLSSISRTWSSASR